MVRIMGELAVDGVYRREWFMPDMDRSQQVLFFQRPQGSQQAVPAFVP
jgi:hypothetical protein